jgi:uncharacterized protein (TIGR02145 family)
MKISQIVILLSILFVISCKKDTLDIDPATYVLAPTSIIIDDTTSQLIQEVDSLKVVFDGNTTLLEDLTVGNIIISGIAPNAPYGFLRKITNIEKIGSTYTFTTVEVPLEEAFEELHVDYTKSFTPADTGGRIANTFFTIDLPNIILYDEDGNNSTTSDQIKISENIKLTPSFRFAVDISNFKLEYATVEGNFETILNQSLTAGGTVGSISKEINILEKSLAPYPLPGLPFLVVVPNLRISLGANANINVNVTASQIITSNVNASIEYQNRNWDKNYTQTLETSYETPSINGSISLKAYVEPAIDFKLYNSNWAKGSVLAQGYLKATGTLLPTPDCELKAGISAGAEANLQFFGWNFTAVSYPEIFDYSKILYTCSNANNPPNVDFSANQTNINTGSSINFTDLSSGNPTTWSWTFEGGTPSIATLQNPIIQYNTPGTYTVSLTASNATGSNTETKTAYIEVNIQNNQLPTINTSAISGITNTTALSGGNITEQGGSAVTARGVCWSINPNPTITNSKTIDGSGTGSFISEITGLASNTTYHVRAYATNTTGTAYGNEFSFTTQLEGSTITDIDGNVYSIITIGTQVWMLQNLKTSKYNDGTTIPTGLSNTAWENTTSGAYAIYDNNAANNTTYGKLYNWYAVNTGKLCPEGWHIPTDAEWTVLTSFLGGLTVAGGKMKSTNGWQAPNAGATNSSGFTGLPGGLRFYNGFYYNVGSYGYWWSSTEYDSGFARDRLLLYDSSVARRDGNGLEDGLSCRCLRD